MKYFIGITILLSCFLSANAQEFGGNRFSTRWWQLNTDTARIIFPEGTDTVAQQIAHIVHSVAAKNLMPLGNRLQKINIVLQPRTAVSNGYAGLGPYRSEFFMTPPSDNFSLGTVNWAAQLAVHEYRHIQQYNNFFNGTSKVIHHILGEEGYALAINASIPNWFFEGDAVYQETILSPQGRGRMPSFLKAYPVLWQAGKNYSWMKLRNGSLKDYVPGHYELGYLLVNYGYEKYGPEFWANVTKDASAFKGLFYPMQRAVKKYSGLRFKDFTNQALDYYRDFYKQHIEHQLPDTNYPLQGISLSKTKAQSNTRKQALVSNIYYPQQMSVDSVVYLKNSYTQRPAFYIKNNNTEQRLRFRDISIDEQFSYRNGRLVYAAFESHPRWQWENYSVIKVLDVKTNTQRTLQHQTNYFSPDISEDGKTIVATQVSPGGKSSLLLLNSENGQIENTFSADSIGYFADPKFWRDGKVIAAIRLQNAKSFIGLINFENHSIRQITSPSFNTVGYVSVQGDNVYFSASQGLKDEVFCTNILTGDLQQLKSPHLINHFPNAGFSRVNYSFFTAFGYKHQSLKAEESIWETVDENHFTNSQAGIVSSNHSNTSGIFDATPARTLPLKRYAKLTRPFNFHSWRPNYDDPIFDFSIYGNNILNTVETVLQYQYNQNDGSHAVGGSLIYGGLFPLISVGSKYTFDRNITVANNLKLWNQWDNYAGINIPLNWSSNQTQKSFNWGATYFYRTDFNKGFYRDTFRTIKFGYLLHQLSWTQQVQRARQHIYPMWGYNASTQFRHTLNFYNGWQLYGRGTIFTPGIFAAHSFYVTGAYQHDGERDRVFGNRFPFARGYNAVDSARLWGLSFNYHLPVAYPDLGFANLFYLQRVRANLFYDYSQISGVKTSFKKDLISAGAELLFDTNWWNQHLITLGVRSGYLLKPDPLTKNKKFFIEMVLPVSLIPR